MAALQPPVCDFGAPAPAFSLPGVDDKTHDLASVSGPKGTLIMFICNHCPYVKAIASHLAPTAKRLEEAGIGVAAIMPNDAEAYPEDSFAHMRLFAERHGFPFPYLIDETQEVARAYGAVCTPDFFGYDANGGLQYRGRLDATTPSKPAPADGRQELLEAMLQVAETGKGPKEQNASIGCSIKWKE